MQTIKRRDSFTVVELLLGLAMAAVIGLSIYNMFWSAMKLDDKTRRVYDSYIELLLADQAMTHDLENAVTLDFSASYPDALIFDGQEKEFSFLTQTPSGIKRVRYYSGQQGDKGGHKPMIGRVVNPGRAAAFDQPSSVEFLLRQESSLADWLNETTSNTTTQIVAAGLQKGSFNCKYAPWSKDIFTLGEQAVDYQVSWDEKKLPMAASCSFKLYDPKNARQMITFKRDIFLPPVAG